MNSIPLEEIKDASIYPKSSAPLQQFFLLTCILPPPKKISQPKFKRVPCFSLTFQLFTFGVARLLHAGMIPEAKMASTQIASFNF